MRFLMVDRVVLLEPGRRIEAVKCFGLADECLRGHFPRRPLVPGALLVEAIAQTLGRLVQATHGFRHTTVLGALDDVRFVPDLEPGRALTVVGELLSTGPKGSVGRGVATVDGREACSVGRVLYAHLPHPDPEALRSGLRALGGVP